MKVLNSPNFDDRTQEIKYLILHYTGMATGKEAIDRLCSAEAKVSAHYVVEKDGEIFSLVPEEKRAWHAGVSKWEDDIGLNDLSVGVEIVNTGHPYPGYESEYKPFTEAQMKSVIQLSKTIIKKHHIKPWHVLGHSDIAWRRKIDPGELFDWKRLSQEGVGLWAGLPQNVKSFKIDINDFMNKLASFGYDTGSASENPSEIITAFQRHFRMDNIDGQLDAETVQLLDSLLRQKIS